MGLTKQYLRYAPLGSFNIIASVNCNVAFVVLNNEAGRFLAVGASEDIIVWDLRLSEKRLVIRGEKHEVTQIAPSPNKDALVAGYSDGSVKTYDLTSTDNLNTFSGHRAAVTCFAFDPQGHRLASGSLDTEIVVWDLVAEAGLIRLSGHKGVVTQVQFLRDTDTLVSSSKDTFIKLWDIATGHCFKTIAGHVTEVWGLCLMRDGDFIVAGSADNELRVWQVSEVKNDDQNNKENQTLVGEDDCTSQLSPVACMKAGSLLRSGKGRVLSLRQDPSSSLLAVLNSKDNTIELFQFLNEEEATAKLKKRLRKQRKKAAKSESAEEVQEVELADEKVSLRDTVRRLPVVKCSSRPKSVHLILGKGSQLRVCVSLYNNTVELYSLDISDSGKVAEVTKLRSISNDGHHSEVRAVAFSSDNLAIVSGSAEKIKMWNRPSLACLRSVETDYALSVIFVPGDRHVLVGCKNGHLQIIDISVGDVLEDIPAHTAELWSICHLPDLSGVVTGGGDNTVKFWQLELVPDTQTKAKVLSLLHTRTLQLEDSVLCVRVSADSKLLAVALLDSTVKIFFFDTLKFFISLYGHNLPVLCMDISSDSRVIATGSADRNVKIWGLDFGDCHKSIFAHDDSVTSLAFVHNTHYFFTCGKDGKVKQWDADNFQKIITLDGHHGEAWGLAVSPNGQYVVSCGQDRVLRLYERTSEPLVLDDEQEGEREAEEELATGQDSVAPTNINLASRKTVTAEKAAELLLECLQVGGEYRTEAEESLKAGRAPPPPPAIMAAFNAKTADDYLMEVIKRIKASDLEETLLLLPYTSVCEMLPLLKPLLQRQLHSDIICRLLVFLVRVHYRPISASPNLQPLIAELSQLALTRAKELRDLIGVNYHGLLFFQRDMEAREGVQLFRDATVKRKEREKKKRKREKAIQRAILTL